MGENWIERRYAIEYCLAKDKGEVWNSVRSALQDACESFNKHYASRGELTIQLENGFRIRISFPSADLLDQLEHPVDSIIVVFNPKIPAIDWAFADGSHSIVISSDEHEAFLVEDGKRLTPDDLSRKILEPLVFGKQ
jgi:hypothetical protein